MVPKACGIIPAQVDAVRVQQQAAAVRSHSSLPHLPVSVGDLPASPVGKNVRILRLEGPRPVVGAVVAPARRLQPAIQLHLEDIGVGFTHPAMIEPSRSMGPTHLRSMDGVEPGRLHRIQPRRPLGILTVEKPRKPRSNRKLLLSPPGATQQQRYRNQEMRPSIAHRALILPQDAGSTLVLNEKILPSKGGSPLSGT